MGIFGGYLAGTRAAREDALRERQQNELERRNKADEDMRQQEARRAQANADRQFEQTQANADRDYALRSRASDLDAALKAQDMDLRQRLGELDYDIKKTDAAGRAEDRLFNREIKQLDTELSRERLAGDKEDRALRGELGRAELEGKKEDRALRREESVADRGLRQQALDQGAYQFERTQANADQTLGLQLEKGRIETEVLGQQLAETKQRWADEQKERDLRKQNSELGVGYMMSMAMMKPGHQLDANDIAEITKQYPEFAKLGLQGFTMKYNPDTGNMDGFMIVGDGNENNHAEPFDQAQMGMALRAAGYTEDSIKTAFERMKPDTALMKLRRATTQEQAKQEEIRKTYAERDERTHANRMNEARFKAEIKAVNDDLHATDLYIEAAKQNKADGWEQEVERLEQKKEDLLNRRDELYGTPSATPAPTADPLVSKYGQYLKK